MPCKSLLQWDDAVDLYRIEDGRKARATCAGQGKLVGDLRPGGGRDA